MRLFTVHRSAVRAMRRAVASNWSCNQTLGFQMRTHAATAATAATIGQFLFSSPQIYDVNSSGIRDEGAFREEVSAYSRFSGVPSPNDVAEIIRDTYYDIHSKVETFMKKQLACEGGRDVLYITAVNIAIYTLWKVAPSHLMHRGLFHLGANMYVLNKYGPDVADVLGSHRFFLFYGTAGVASSLASLSFRRLTRNHYLSLGASGAVAATLWLYASLFPKRRMSVLGSDYIISMQEFALAFTVMDVAGLLGSAGKIDFAAHLGGALFANVWFQLVRDKLLHEQRQRERRDRWSLSRFASRTMRGVNGKESA